MSHRCAYCPPSAVICIGMNYSAHAAESGSAPPDIPIIFLKTPNTVVGPNDTVSIPRTSEKTDWEVELGIVIKKRASYLEFPGDSIDHITDFVTANDLSGRDFQMAVSGGQRSKGKCGPGFNPAGPWLVTPGEVDFLVNGEPRQGSTPADMIFDVDHIVWHLSQYLTLEPGDIVEIEIEGLGYQRQEFVQAQDGSRQDGQKEGSRIAAELDGLVVVITGGASGIGAAIARQFSDGGAPVACGFHRKMAVFFRL